MVVYIVDQRSVRHSPPRPPSHGRRVLDSGEWGQAGSQKSHRLVQVSCQGAESFLDDDG